jgi:cyclohexa-1,5-dienecarbonyl-CoA hydratase
LNQISKPVVAVVDGPAFGGGCELVAACDIVIASERARFGQPEIKLGVFPPVAAVILPRIIGEKKAREMVLLGEIVDANEALRLGLVNYVVPSAELNHQTDNVLAKLSELSSVSLQFTRNALDLGRQGEFESALTEVENLYLNELMKTEDASEGVRSFMEKRKPEWRNR